MTDLSEDPPDGLELEIAMDELAERLGMNPVKLRILNDTQVDPEKTSRPFSQRHPIECMRIGAEQFGWGRRHPTPGSQREGEWLVGMGMLFALDEVIPATPQKSFGALLDQAWIELASERFQPFMHLWLDLAAGAARDLQPHRQIAGRIADGFLSWVSVRIMPDNNGKASPLAPCSWRSSKGHTFSARSGEIRLRTPRSSRPSLPHGRGREPVRERMKTFVSNACSDRPLLARQNGPVDWAAQGDVNCTDSYNGRYAVSGCQADAAAALERELRAVHRRVPSEAIIVTEFNGDAMAESMPYLPRCGAKIIRARWSVTIWT